MKLAHSKETWAATRRHIPRTLLVMLPLMAVSHQGSVATGPGVAEVFAPGVISREGRIEFAAAFTPDMREVFFSVRLAPRTWSILYSKLKNGEWCEPVTAPFSGTWSDLEPSVSPDGTRLFFSSNRPIEGNQPRGDYDIWYSELGKDGWTAARHAGPAVNGAGDQWRPVSAARGTLYFSSVGLWKAAAQGESYGRPEKVSAPGEPGPVVGGHGFVAPDESFLLTSWVEGPDHRGGWDIYVSFRTPEGHWTPSVNLGSSVNSEADEDFPCVSPDGRFLFFYRHAKSPAGAETGDIYRIPWTGRRTPS